MVLDLILVHLFFFLVLIGLKMFLELIIVFLCILIIRKNILVLVEGPTQGLDDTRITAEAKYSINFSR